MGESALIKDILRDYAIKDDRVKRHLLQKGKSVNAVVPDQNPFMKEILLGYKEKDGRVKKYFKKY